MQFQFIGCGDAFGSGGRFNTCFNVVGKQTNFLIDCGASSLIAMKKYGVSHNEIDMIFFTHFHADHFGGLPFLILDAQFFSKRQKPLKLVGPRGLKDWYVRAMETAFPGSSGTKQRFDLTFLELTPGKKVSIDDLSVVGHQVSHGNPGGPFLALRIEVEEKVVAYTGDTEWTENLVDVAHGADLFVAEAYFYEKKVPLHLDVKTITDNLSRLAPKRLILTHMSDDMLHRTSDLDFEFAEDGKTITF